jgi:hypothetical protein
MPLFVVLLEVPSIIVGILLAKLSDDVRDVDRGRPHARSPVRP